MNVLLSVIVPIYNVKQYVEKCIKSICNQSYSNLEIILVDDGSTDGSEQICDQFALQDKRIQVIHKQNGGLVSARKSGARAATGDYIVSVDGDDWIDKDRFKNLVDRGLNNSPSMVYMAGYYKEYKDSSSLTHQNIYASRYNEKQILTEFMSLLAGTSVFFERKVVLPQFLWCVKRDIYCQNQLRVDDRIDKGEDNINIFSCILESKMINCIYEPSYHYVQRKESITFQKTVFAKKYEDLYYKQMKNILLQHRVNEETTNVAVQYVFHNILWTNYEKLYDRQWNFLFPYPQVKEGCRIIIYGAGNIGTQIVKAIDKRCRFKIVAWVDKNIKKDPCGNHNVENPLIIKDKQYDYIVVAVADSEISLSIREMLMSNGISENKIALMQSSVMSMEILDELMKNE